MPLYLKDELGLAMIEEVGWHIVCAQDHAESRRGPVLH